MKKLLLLIASLAACELQPAPPPPPPPSPAAAPAAPAAPSPAPAPVPTGSAGSAGSAAATQPPAPQPVDATPECEQAGIKLAELMIAGAEDSQKPAFERDRTNIIRRTELACTQQHWLPAALACINQSKTDQDARACLEKFPAPGTQTGSAAPVPTPPGPGSMKERRPAGLDVHGAAGPKPHP